MWVGFFFLIPNGGSDQQQIITFLQSKIESNTVSSVPVTIRYKAFLKESLDVFGWFLTTYV